MNELRTTLRAAFDKWMESDDCHVESLTPRASDAWAAWQAGAEWSAAFIRAEEAAEEERAGLCNWLVASGRYAALCRCKVVPGSLRCSRHINR